ncbi:NADPH-dependent FMN reductase [Pelistega suis]|uniref:NAD(P)H-dependent oxidoreductase n=1 Tax=Pelistega suis TaxID=1631957 RepID=A0A849P1C2_9BURK|nr:NAD(P)H-dependent oxidoreductase [Pelistega suis]NOL51519.1 NAD(P)H-dependent oxidoreductase [Pelistega suis]
MNFLIFLGSVRDSTPPKPARLGQRVAIACHHYLQAAFPNIHIEIIDPLDYPLERVFKPHFAYAKGKAPDSLEQLATKIAQADGYVMISPEYNHSMSPALMDLLNHFGSSLFSFKPSAIVTYSAGQWGGMRAAVNMRTFLSELGCLSVSAMIHIPKAQEVLDEQGNFIDGVEASQWQTYFARTFLQLHWWAQATKAQRQVSNPFEMTPPFLISPTQRNAP